MRANQLQLSTPTGLKEVRTMTNTSSPRRQALGIGLEEFDYPYPVEFLPVVNDLQSLTMAYMDVPPSSEANGSTVVLMHGRPSAAITSST